MIQRETDNKINNNSMYNTSISQWDKKTILLQLKPLRENERGIENRVSFVRNLWSLKSSINLWITGNNTNIKLFLSCESKQLQFIENMFYASYPDSELILSTEKIKPANEFITMTKKTVIRDHTSYTQWGSYMSPLHDILSLFNTVDVESILTIQLTFQFNKTKTLFDKAISLTKDILFGKKEKSDNVTETQSISTITPEIRVRIGCHIQTTNIVIKQWLRDQFFMLMKWFITAGKIDLKSTPQPMIPMLRSQAVNFFHIPTQQHFTKALDYAVYRKLPYPYPLPTEWNTPKDEFTLIGTTDYRNDKINFGMIEEDKFRHMYIVGKTGTGKSTFLSNLIANDIKNGKGIGLLDPHGELVETVLEHIPSHRTNDVILFDVSDSDFPIWFNLLQAKDADEKTRIVSGVVTTFAKLFAHSRWPRLEYILRNILLTLIDYPNATLMHILRILTDKNFREEVLKHTTDTMILKFWRDEYDKWDERQKQEAMWPITNKIGQFLSSAVVRNIFGQPRSKLNLREAMDSGKIILINLSKGKIGEDNASMIGSLLVTKFQIDAMSRADIRPEERVPFYLYIDEFQNFATDSFATILSEARKYKLSLIMANQYTSQLLETIRDAIFGNIWSIFSFTIGYDDAKVISSQFKEMVSPNDLISLPRFTAYTRMMIDGVTSDPFSMKTMPLPTPEWSHEQTKKIIEQSRQRYSMPKNELEKLLEARQKRTFSPAERVALRGTLEWKGIPSDTIEAFFNSGEDDREGRYNINKDNFKTQADKKIVQSLSTQDSKKESEIDTENIDKINTVANNTNIDTTKDRQKIDNNIFNLDNISIGNSYQWYIKLQFNYGLFVTVKWVEGLLHKNELICPDEVNWKKYFNIGDPITVKAKEKKEINGEMRIVWTMK